MIDRWLPVRDSTGAIRKLPVRVVPPQNGLNGTIPHTSAFRDNPVNVSNQAVGEEDISILRHIKRLPGPPIQCWTARSSSAMRHGLRHKMAPA